MPEATIFATNSFFSMMSKRRSQDRRTLMHASPVRVCFFAAMVIRLQQTTTNFVKKTNSQVPATSIWLRRFASLRLVSRTVTTSFSSREKILSSLRLPTVLSAVKMLTTLLKRTPLRSMLRLCSSRMTILLESLTSSARWTSMFATNLIAEAE